MRRLVVVTVAVLVLSGCGEDQPDLVATDVSSIRVTGEQKQVPAFSAHLSPNGETLLYSSQNGPCVRGVDGSNEHCLDDIEPDTGSAAWSPDGSKLALTDALVIGLEPDLWVLDVDSGDLTNLTDDGVESEGFDLTGTEILDGAAYDVYPSWSSDGEHIRFVRRKSADTLTLMTIPADGGDPEQLRSIDTNWEKLQEVAWAQDTIAWLSGPPDGGAGEVLVADLADSEPRKVLDGEYRILSLSSDGQFLLADQRGADGAAAENKARVVPTVGGDPIPVAKGKVTAPTWSPEGHAIAYVEAPGTLRLVGKPGDKPHDLHKAPRLGAADLDNLDWAPGKLLVTTAEDTPVVLTITE